MKYSNLLFLLPFALLWNSCSDDSDEFLHDQDYDIEFEITGADSFKRSGTFVKTSSQEYIDAYYEWNWGDGSNKEKLVTDTTSHTFLGTDSIFEITLELHDQYTGKLLASTSDTLDFNEYITAPPFDVEASTFTVGTWDTNISWSYLNNDQDDVYATYMTLALDSNYTQLINVFEGTTSTDAEEDAEVARSGLSDYTFKNLEAETTYFFKVRLEELDGPSSNLDGSFTTNNVRPPDVVTSYETMGNAISVYARSNNYITTDTPIDHEFIITTTPALEKTSTENGITKYFKPIGTDATFSITESTTGRPTNTTSPAGTDTYNNQNINVFYKQSTSSGQDLPLPGTVYAQVYDYQGNKVLYIGETKNSATFNAEGMHITFGTNLPAVGNFNLNSGNTKIINNSIGSGSPIGLIGSAGINSYKLKIFSVDADIIIAAVNNDADFASEQHKLVFNDQSVSTSYLATIDELSFKSISSTVTP
ncbi:hypothetical protein [Flammeovirga kamogawensis]|uniref:PKD domain-containing protein n=1 Tax=Flammeovirga kamogawensis TaxID=373891 RepID=A0ABX8H125_9BACT|nr:hypothetical protein [Flammeovirga kamogawensis]MBB6462206.1 hypothetical protein [Flammeovirga kamogawensis]QWG09393.1 hypothetical protein KM029_22565 [Flammeovirga kamogawensis]TRX64911.1 hypothetical protein EO216_20475 [Flammeovirga kamogawensis]